MKLLVLTFRFEYADRVEAICDRHGLGEFVRQPRVEGSTRDGKHYGTQVHPGNMTCVIAQLPDEKVDAVLDDLRQFRELKAAHEHLQAMVLPVERML